MRTDKIKAFSRLAFNANKKRFPEKIILNSIFYLLTVLLVNYLRNSMNPGLIGTAFLLNLIWLVYTIKKIDEDFVSFFLNTSWDFTHSISMTRSEKSLIYLIESLVKYIPITPIILICIHLISTLDIEKHRFVIDIILFGLIAFPFTFYFLNYPFKAKNMPQFILNPLEYNYSKSQQIIIFILGLLIIEPSFVVLSELDNNITIISNTLEFIFQPVQIVLLVLILYASMVIYSVFIKRDSWFFNEWNIYSLSTLKEVSFSKSLNQLLTIFLISHSALIYKVNFSKPSMSYYLSETHPVTYTIINRIFEAKDMKVARSIFKFNHEKNDISSYFNKKSLQYMNEIRNYKGESPIISAILSDDYKTATFLDRNNITIQLTDEKIKNKLFLKIEHLYKKEYYEMLFKSFSSESLNSYRKRFIDNKITICEPTIHKFLFEKLNLSIEHKKVIINEAFHLYFKRNYRPCLLFNKHILGNSFQEKVDQHIRAEKIKVSEREKIEIDLLR